MDRIEDLIRGLDPVRVADRTGRPLHGTGTAPAADVTTADEATRNAVTGERATSAEGPRPAPSADDDAGVFSDDRPEVVPFRRRRKLAMVLAGAAAAAVVAGAVVVGGNLGAQSPLPAGTTDPVPTSDATNGSTDFQLSPYEQGDGMVFGSLAEAESYAGSAEFDVLAGIADSMVITD